VDGSPGRNGGQDCSVQGVAAADLLGFGGAQLALSGGTEACKLFGLQFAQVARLLIQNQRAVAYAANLFNEVADLLEHFAQFAVAALNEHHFVPGIVALANLPDAGRRGAHLP
jgi:hypothetical protein